jgi:hypothetical protein
MPHREVPMIAISDLMWFMLGARSGIQGLAVSVVQIDNLDLTRIAAS